MTAAAVQHLHYAHQPFCRAKYDLMTSKMQATIQTINGPVMFPCSAGQVTPIYFDEGRLASPIELPAAAYHPEDPHLRGSGDYCLPACGEQVSIFKDEEIAIVVFTTLSGQRVGVPIPSFALRNLGIALISAENGYFCAA